MSTSEGCARPACSVVGTHHDLAKSFGPAFRWCAGAGVWRFGAAAPPALLLEQAALRSALGASGLRLLDALGLVVVVLGASRLACLECVYVRKSCE
jgi:hypothetical protein